MSSSARLPVVSLNRFLAALTLNKGDELVWYKKTKTKHLKCLWRHGGTCITFVSQRLISKVDAAGFHSLEAGPVETVYTRYLPSPKADVTRYHPLPSAMSL